MSGGVRGGSNVYTTVLTQMRRTAMKPTSWTAAVTLALAVGLTLSSVAKEKTQQPTHITVYSDPQSFFQAAKVVNTETFDELPSRTVIGVGSVSLDEVTYTSADASAEWLPTPLLLPSARRIL